PPSRSGRATASARSPERLVAQRPLEREGRGEELAFIEMWRDELSADRQAIHASDRQRQCWHAGKIRRAGINVAQIHVVRLGAGAKLERGRRGGRCEQEMDTVAKDARE